MSNDRERGGKTGLDLFEGLGRKDLGDAPPPPPPPPPPPAEAKPRTADGAPFVREPRKTLLGIPGPSVIEATAAAVASVQARRPGALLDAPPLIPPPSPLTPPPPPPRRGSLPAIAI